MHDYTAPTRTANEIIDIADSASYWNNGGRTDPDLLEYAYTAAAQYGLTEDTMNEIMGAAWRGRMFSRTRYVEEAHKIINAA